MFVNTKPNKILFNNNLLYFFEFYKLIIVYSIFFTYRSYVTKIFLAFLIIKYYNIMQDYRKEGAPHRVN